MKYIKDLSTLIGNTPLLELDAIKETEGLKANIFAKLEGFNPGGSVKDRVALAMIETAEKDGLLKKDTVIIEPTSGNTGIGLAMVGSIKGYKVVLTMPETMSVERRSLLAAYGAKLVLTPGAQGMKGAIAKAEELSAQLPNSFIPAQFDNKANPATHYATTGPEIWEQMESNVDILVAGVGTGGTITGVGRFLKEKNPNIKIVAVEPSFSAVLSGESPGPHQLQGIGAGFIPTVLDTEIYSEIIKIDTDQAFYAARLLAAKQGYLAGISSGAALNAALQLAKLEENTGKNIAVVLPDTGERYLSTPLFVTEN